MESRIKISYMHLTFRDVKVLHAKKILIILLQQQILKHVFRGLLMPSTSVPIRNYYHLCHLRTISYISYHIIVE